MRNNESGNVLFLILIAVALFAALSYAVTQTTRPNSLRTDKTSTINAAQLIQYPTGLRTAILRMVIDGISADELEFNIPADFTSLSNNTIGVFHPDGGGAVYNPATTGIMASGLQGDWYFNMNFEIEHIGLSVVNNLSGNDLIAFLPGIRRSVCENINETIGINSSIPNSTADLSAPYTSYMDNTYTLPANEVILGTSGSNGTDALTGQPYGCFQNNGGEYVYYQVLIER
ncbi:MAG: hypothetical protein R3E13_04570 [Alphaproteobacteria bacterium]